MKIEIKWVPEIPHLEDPVIWIDVARFDSLWKDCRDTIEHHRVERIGVWIAAGNALGMAQVNAQSGEVSFTNGRHRFCWCRDCGLKTIPVTVPLHQAAELMRLAGSHVGGAQVPTPARYDKKGSA